MSVNCENICFFENLTHYFDFRFLWNDWVTHSDMIQLSVIWVYFLSNIQINIFSTCFYDLGWLSECDYKVCYFELFQVCFHCDMIWIPTPGWKHSIKYLHQNIFNMLTWLVMDVQACFYSFICFFTYTFWFYCGMIRLYTLMLNMFDWKHYPTIVIRTLLLLNKTYLNEFILTGQNPPLRFH